jgi:alkylation response protein AidB-like acyl-CoA dehydrogenase
MRFALSAEQRQFGAALHELLADAGVPAAARAWGDGDHGPGLAIWAALAKAGVTALMVPESFGGLGADPVDLVVACEELGHHPVPGPIAESIAAIPVLLAELTELAPPTTPIISSIPAARAATSLKPAPDPALNPATPAAPQSPITPQAPPSQSSREQRGHFDAAIATPKCPRCEKAGGETVPWLGEAAGWLGEMAGGGMIATIAMPPLVPYALDADVAGLVLLAQGDWVGRGSVRSELASMDPARRLFGVSPGEALAAGPRAGSAVALAVRHGTLASAALLLGAGRGLLDAAAGHARTREQFGRPVGAFQSVKHALADVLIAVEFARPLLYAAAIALRHGSATAARDVSAARVACADAARLAARTALQVHGAIGYTREGDVGLWLAKVRALSSAWGSQAEHRAVVLGALAEPETGPWS